MDAEESSLFTTITIIVFVIGFIIVYFFVSIVRQQRRNLQLHKKYILAEITQIEKERSRIAADLHDELGPLLSAVKMKINSFELQDEEDKIQILKTNDHINDILKRMREISFDLMPNSLLRKGIVAAVKEFTNYLSTNSGIKFYFNGEKDLKLTEQNSVNIYRIIQEVIHNTIKHAQATEVHVELKTQADIILIRISDNGIGFDYAKQLNENIGIGLTSLLRRTEIMSGQMFLDSAIGKGTTYTFEIPL